MLNGGVIPVPSSTSIEAFEKYVGGTCVKAGTGAAWQGVKAWSILPPRVCDGRMIPAVNEPFLAWTYSGDVVFEERETGGPWKACRLRRGSFFLTNGGDAYECRWRSVGREVFDTLAVFIELPLLKSAFEEVFGADAPRARLRDLSAFTDETLDFYMVRLREELLRKTGSPILIRGLGEVIAIHLARHYAEAIDDPRGTAPSLPGFKLKQITAAMARNLAEDFSLERLAAQAQLSKFHFSRLFKAATGRSPSRYQLDLRLNTARRLLRETDRSIIEIALEVGYRNPSRFAQLFRRETGLTPSEYRRRR